MAVPALVTIFGCIFGSFFNVCIHRIPKGKSIAFPASHCPHCLHPIPWYHNLPVLSFCLLQGRCASCQRSISPVYPLVEAATGLVFLLLYLRFVEMDTLAHWTTFAVYAVFAGSLIILSVIDIRYLIIPDRFTLGGIVAGILFSTVHPAMHGFGRPAEGFIFSAVSALLAFLALNSIRLLGNIVYGREAMGFGDIKLVAAFGAFLGWKLALLAIFMAAVAGSIVGILAIVFRNHHLKSEIPFGPYLALGAMGAMFYGEALLQWYFRGILW